MTSGIQDHVVRFRCGGWYASKRGRMRGKCTAALFFAVLMAQVASAAPPAVTISKDGHFLVIDQQGKSVRMHLPDTSPEARFPVSADFAVVLAHQRREAVDYLLVLVNGMSLNGGNPRGHCGAGVEQRVWWLAIGNGGVHASKHQSVASCWHRTESDSIVWNRGVCKVTWIANHDATDETHYALLYDTHKPEKGFDVMSTGMPPPESPSGHGVRREEK